MGVVFIPIRATAVYVYRSGHCRENENTNAACMGDVYVKSGGNWRLFVRKRSARLAVGGNARNRSRFCFFFGDDAICASFAKRHASGGFVGDGVVIRLFACRFRTAAVWIALRYNKRMDATALFTVARFRFFIIGWHWCGERPLCDGSVMAARKGRYRCMSYTEAFVC